MISLQSPYFMKTLNLIIWAVHQRSITNQEYQFHLAGIQSKLWRQIFCCVTILPKSGNRNLTAPNSTRTKSPNANQECEQLGESDNVNCKAKTCHIFITNSEIIMLCVSLKYIMETLQHLTGPSQSSSIRETNIWMRPAICQLPLPNEDQEEHSIDQIIGNLPNLRLPRSNNLRPPSTSAREIS